MNVKNLLLTWLNDYEKERVKPRTYTRYKSIIELHLSSTLGEVPLDDLKRRDVQQFLLDEKKYGNLSGDKPLSSSSVNLILTVLNSAFEYAVDMELCDSNPCLRLKRIPDDTKAIEAFTREEQKKIENYIIENGDRKLFGILLDLYSGLRIGELLALEWSDIDFEKCIINVNKTVYRDNSKTGKWEYVVDKPKTKSSERVVPMPKCIVDLFKRHKLSARSKYVIENKEYERMSVRSYQYIFQKLTEKAGVRRLNFHAMRHTFATRAIECGMDIKTLSEIMGHKNASITLNRYAHSMLDTKIAMMNKLQFIL